METVADFIFLGSKITADSDCMKSKDACSLEEKLWQTWQHIKKQRHYFADKGPHSQSYPVIMYGCESWTIKKAECQRIYTFELWCLRRHLRVPWTERRSNQSILKKSILHIHWKDWCWSWSSSTLVTWSEEPTHQKRPRAEGEGGNRGWDGWSHQLNGHEVEQRQEIVKDSEVWHAVVCGVRKSWTWLSDWPTTSKYLWTKS